MNGNSYICKVLKNFTSTNKINLAKNFTSEKYYFITDNINVTGFPNKRANDLAKSQINLSVNDQVYTNKWAKFGRKQNDFSARYIYWNMINYILINGQNLAENKTTFPPDEFINLYA